MTYIKRKTFSKRIDKLKEKARTLYKQGLTMREVGERVKRSRQWVANVVKDSNGTEKF